MTARKRSALRWEDWPRERLLDVRIRDLGLTLEGTWVEACVEELYRELEKRGIAFRPLDHQSTMGAYVGRTTVKDGKGVMVDWRYADGKDYLPPDAVVRALRPQ